MLGFELKLITIMTELTHMCHVKVKSVLAVRNLNWLLGKL